VTSGGSKRALRARKRSVRARMREVRGAIPEAERGPRAAAALERLLALPRVAEASGVMLFASFGSEIPTDAFAPALRARGARTYLPFLMEGRIEPADVDPDEPGALVATSYGPREPADRTPAPLGAIDVVMVAGLAFDRSGYRVGYGGGYYDAFLLRLGPEPLRVGLAFHEQVLDEVPHGPGDEPVDILVTDRETIPCNPTDEAFGAGSR
jgi:5-formyltetrahydrofolate cyclo-ligase